jgi:hypothetical protein
MNDLIPHKELIAKIYFIRGKKVMIDYDLANLYGVITKALNQAVKRNIERFPEDFMFQLTDNELENLKSHTVTANGDDLKSQTVTSSHGGRRTLPFAFTEQGVAMLSGILRSEKAVKVNIAIMRAFVKMRELIDENKELKKKLDELENRYDKQFKIVFDALRQWINPPNKSRKVIGFKTGQK